MFGRLIELEMIAVGNYAPINNNFTSIRMAHKIIDRCVIDSEEYWQAIAVLGELLSQEEAPENRLEFTDDDMVMGYF